MAWLPSFASLVLAALESDKSRGRKSLSLVIMIEDIYAWSEPDAESTSETGKRRWQPGCDYAEINDQRFCMPQEQLRAIDRGQAGNDDPIERRSRSG